MELSLKSYQGCLVRRPHPPAHEATSAGTPVSNWGYPCSLENMVGQLFSGHTR
uniref:hypothetical protein n=1 Tax=Candidatus Cryptobacteroides bacterium TaxID=3085639 RepID=UPI004029ECB4